MLIVRIPFHRGAGRLVVLSTSGTLLYNTLTTSTTSCSSSYKCACQTPSLVAAVAANSVAVAALNGAFFSITTGTCASHGYGVITTAAECEAAAVALGWSDVVVDSGYTGSWSSYPPGCILDSNGNLYHNTKTTWNTNTCSGISFTCACQTPGLVAVVAELTRRLCGTSCF